MVVEYDARRPRLADRGPGNGVNANGGRPPQTRPHVSAEAKGVGVSMARRDIGFAPGDVTAMLEALADAGECWCARRRCCGLAYCRVCHPLAHRREPGDFGALVAVTTTAAVMAA